MTDNTSKAANMARTLAIADLIVGFLLVCFGVVDRVLENYWTGYVYFGIWTGVWMCIAGGLGIPGTRKKQSISRNIFAGIFMGFSIASSAFGGVIIICYSISIAYNLSYYKAFGGPYSYMFYYKSRLSGKYEAVMAVSSIILILGVVEFAIGIWAAVCICLMNPCCTPPQQGQVMYTAEDGYVMTREPAGLPVAIPMQAGKTTGHQAQQVGTSMSYV